MYRKKTQFDIIVNIDYIDGGGERMKIPSFERRNQIMHLLLENQYVEAELLAQKFDVSMETIRKDLLYLDKIGIAFKEHGGARISPLGIERPIDMRVTNQNAKKMIALEAIKRIEEAQVIFVDAGSTCQEVAKLLNQLEGLDIITNSLLAFDVLDDERNNILLCGGKKRQKNRSLVGNWCVRSIESIHIDICFMGTSGFYNSKGPTTHSYREIETKMALMRSSDLIYVLAEADKFKEQGLHTFSDWSEIDGLICDDSLSSKTYEKFKKSVPIIIAQEEENEKNSKD